MSRYTNAMKKIDEIKNAIENHESFDLSIEEVKSFAAILKDARNDVCYQCGKYKDAHIGACKNCGYEK